MEWSSAGDYVIALTRLDDETVDTHSVDSSQTEIGFEGLAGDVAYEVTLMAKDETDPERRVTAGFTLPPAS